MYGIWLASVGRHGSFWGENAVRAGVMFVRARSQQEEQGHLSSLQTSNRLQSSRADSSDEEQAWFGVSLSEDGLPSLNLLLMNI